MTCVGQVAYFVKCKLANDEAKRAARALGISDATHRFAIVDAWTVEDVQQGIQEQDARTPWAKQVAKALVQAKVLHSEADLKRLFRAAQESASVLAMPTDGRVMLQHAAGRGGTLRRLAVPVSSLYEQYYGREGSNWGVHPVVRIDKRKVSVNVTLASTREPGGVNEARKAIKAIQRRSQYFVHTHSKSNNKR